jgi:hypothetical protein
MEYYQILFSLYFFFKFAISENVSYEAVDLDIYMLCHVFSLLCDGPFFKNLFYVKWPVYTKIKFVTKCSVEPQYKK